MLSSSMVELEASSVEKTIAPLCTSLEQTFFVKEKMFLAMIRQQDTQKNM